MAESPDTVVLARIRRAVALLATVVAAGGLLELGLLRHWSGVQLVPWFVFGLIAVVGLATAADRGPTLLARAAGVVGILGAGFGAFQHLRANHALGPLIPPYAERWSSMSALEQWWAAATGSLGSAPAMAPGLLAMAGVLLIVAVMDRSARA